MITGELLEKTLENNPEFKYYVYLPTTCSAQTKLFVTVHGISRNAKEHAEKFMGLAELYGVAMIAPFYSKEHFSDYNCLGRAGKARARADIYLNKAIAEVGKAAGICTDHFYMFGYSAGGQFAHRYAMAYPDRVIRAVIGAAGWYTFPDAALEYPQGTHLIGNDLPGIVMDPARFLRIPFRVLVGALDVKRDASLNQNADIDRTQGLTRVERGRKWIQAMRSAAKARGLRTEYDFQLLPDAAHGFGVCMDIGNMGPDVFTFLFREDMKEGKQTS